MRSICLSLSISFFLVSCGRSNSNGGEETSKPNVDRIVSGAQAQSTREEILKNWESWEAEVGSMHSVIKPGGETSISWSNRRGVEKTCYIIFDSEVHTYEQLTKETKKITREYINPTLGPLTTAKPKECKKYFLEEDPNIEGAQAFAAALLVNLDQLPEETLKQMGLESVALARIEIGSLQGHKFYTFYFAVKGSLPDQINFDSLVEDDVEIEGELSIGVTTDKVASGWLWYTGFKGIANGKTENLSTRMIYKYDDFEIPIRD